MELGQNSIYQKTLCSISLIQDMYQLHLFPSFLVWNLSLVGSIQSQAKFLFVFSTLHIPYISIEHNFINHETLVDHRWYYSLLCDCRFAPFAALRSRLPGSEDSLTPASTKPQTTPTHRRMMAHNKGGHSSSLVDLACLDSLLLRFFIYIYIYIYAAHPPRLVFTIFI